MILNLENINPMFLAPALYREFGDLKEYLDFMAVHKQPPKRVHVTPELFAALAIKYPGHDFRYCGTHIQCINTEKLKTLLASQKSRQKSKKDKNSFLQNMRNYIASRKDF